MASSETGYDRIMNPIDLVEELASAHDWATDRTGDDELTLVVGGNWTDYHVSLNWRDDLEALHLACAFDFRVPDTRLNEMYRLIAQINEQLWLGHFDLEACERYYQAFQFVVWAGKESREALVSTMFQTEGQA
jgi:hypothetical protein